MASIKQGTPVHVKWVDSSTYQGWRSTRETFEAEPCESVGYMVSDTPSEIVLAGSRAASQWCQIITIPKVAIKKIRRLK